MTRRRIGDPLTIDEMLAVEEAERGKPETSLYPYDAVMLCAEVRRQRERHAKLQAVALKVLRRVGVDHCDFDDIDAYFKLEARLRELEEKS